MYPAFRTLSNAMGTEKPEEVGSADEVRQRIHDLRTLATQVVKVCKAQARRPFILELAGTPKAGKTTTLRVLRDFLKETVFYAPANAHVAS